MSNKESQRLNWSAEQVEAIIEDLAHLRLMADIELVPKYPYFGDKPYPLGRCKEIRDAVFMLLQQKLKNPKSPGLILIRDALSKGASLTKAWGSLRDVYFQNAIILQGWYLDVSNDTVNPNKQRVEVLPLHQSGFSTIVHFEQFAQIARQYWEVEIYRNDVCPALAPFLPFIYVKKDGTSWMGEASDDMISVAMNSAFSYSERILTVLPSLPSETMKKWRKALLSTNHHELIHGQGDVLEYCQQYRIKGYHVGADFRDSVVMAFLALPKNKQFT